MTKILDIELYDKGLKSAVHDFVTIPFCETKKNRCISATGAHGLVIAKSDPQFQIVLNSFWRNLPDGMPGVWVGRIKGSRTMERCYGPDLFKLVMQDTSYKNINHYFCGGKSGVAKELKVISEESFRNNHIVGYYSPPFRELSENEFKELAKDINKLNTDVVWIGLSTPKQEKFAYQLAKYLDVHFIVTVGAAFDFHTGKVKQAPKLMQKLGLEWLFRLLMEPRRLYKRYFEIVPLFIYYNMEEFFYYLFKNKD